MGTWLHDTILECAEEMAKDLSGLKGHKSDEEEERKNVKIWFEF